MSAYGGTYVHKSPGLAAVIRQVSSRPGYARDISAVSEDGDADDAVWCGRLAVNRSALVGITDGCGRSCGVAGCC
jgi:hypothetical protein